MRKALSALVLALALYGCDAQPDEDPPPPPPVKEVDSRLVGKWTDPTNLSDDYLVFTKNTYTITDSFGLTDVIPEGTYNGYTVDGKLYNANTGKAVISYEFPENTNDQCEAFNEASKSGDALRYIFIGPSSGEEIGAHQFFIRASD